MTKLNHATLAVLAGHRIAQAALAQVDPFVVAANSAAFADDLNHYGPGALPVAVDDDLESSQVEEE